MSPRLRYSVEPRDIPADKAARRLHLTAAEFRDVLPQLLARGFPRPDPTTAMFDLDAIDEWRRRRHPQLFLTQLENKVIKVWRAFWKVMAAMRYCDAASDPSKGLRNTQPRGRSETWVEGEVARLVKRAWRMQFYGLAAIIGVIWDTQFSPGDARRLLGGQQKQDHQGTFYTTHRGKTGKKAIGTVSRRVARLAAAYLKTMGIEVHADAPIFRDARGNPFTMFSLADEFRMVREVEFPEDKRRLMDMRRSGAVEAGAGKVDPVALANKMANSIDRSGELQDTYIPRRVAIVRVADEARRRGRRVIRENE